MERITADLHCAFAQPQVGFTGTTDSMEFIVSRAPELTARPALPAGPTSDLRKVFYYLATSLEGTNFVITGLDRSEETFLTKPTTPGSTARVQAPAPAAGATNAPLAEPLAGAIQFLRLRYWDGT